MSGINQDSKTPAPKLVYVADTRPGITRLKSGKGFGSRECYIHPALMEAYLDSKLPQHNAIRVPSRLNADERRLLAFLENIDAPALGKEGASKRRAPTR